MELYIPTKEEQEVARIFADAVASFNIRQLSSLLHDDGVFQIIDLANEPNDMGIALRQMNKARTIHVNKTAFIQWLFENMETYLLSNPGKIALEASFEQAGDILPGSPVVLLNSGLFPVFNHWPWQKEKTGFLLQFEGNKIVSISFCDTYMNSTNEFLMEKHAPLTLIEKWGKN
ncbi:MAG: hypothetical protein GX587_02460 [Bacteroidales bacterium]|nr:hypothetical protein [Bacteroidales bacterium]